MSGYLCGRSQRALQRSSQKRNSENFAKTEFSEVHLGARYRVSSMTLNESCQEAGLPPPYRLRPGPNTIHQ